MRTMAASLPKQGRREELLYVLLNDVRVGVLARESGGRIRFLFTERYAEMTNRPTLSLSYEAAPGELLSAAPRAYAGRLPPFFSNLLPEGPLRELLIRRAGIRRSDEFALLRALGEDLPGAVRVADPASTAGGATSRRVRHGRAGPDEGPLRFSLAGVQLKMSAVFKAGGGLTIPAAGVGGDWIVKLPAAGMDAVPENEFAMMTLAGEIGIPVPEVGLIGLDRVSGLPDEMRDKGGSALAVRRFDRQEGGRRVHVEDFAQVFGKFPESKYEGHSYANIAAALASTASNGQEEAMAFVRRAIFSALIGNGDAHLKNWSVVYEDPIHPKLSPAYDLVSTIPYIPRDHLALGFGGSRRFQRFGDRRLQRFAKAARLPFEAVRSECRDTTERTLAAWKKHQGRDMLPRRIAEAISNHIESVSLDLAGTR